MFYNTISYKRFINFIQLFNINNKNDFYYEYNYNDFPLASNSNFILEQDGPDHIFVYTPKPKSIQTPTSTQIIKKLKKKLEEELE